MWGGAQEGRARLFRGPAGCLCAYRAGDVLPTLRAVQEAVRTGRHAAGFLTYEAAPGLDAVYATHDPAGLPLVWFGLFREAQDFELPKAAGSPAFRLGGWTPSISGDAYRRAIARIRDYLKAGDTYQVNYTFRLRAPFEGDAWDLFVRLARSQRARYCAFIETGAFAVCSISPELFFSLSRADGRLVSRPMKGTAARGLTWEQDRESARALAQSEKNRAENVMIVDMVRNDMGRIAEPRSVHVERLFEIERYPTLFQMTSTVAAATSASLAATIGALFPCASITGAPKVRTMQIIRELEPDPRGLYTGAIGWLSPDGKTAFNVAIRTLVADKRQGRAEYGVGGGIVWDSDAGSEYEECCLKAAVLTDRTPVFELLETILWEAGTGYFLLDRHLVRLARSAEYFGFRVDPTAIRDRLARDEAAVRGGTGRAPARAHRVRLRVAQAGETSVEWHPLPAARASGPRRVALAPEPVDRNDRFLYHKTTHRAVYEAARRSRPDADDVLLWNEAGEITESTVANVVVEQGGRRVTPPAACGLLPGVFRQWLLDRGEVTEQVVRVTDLRRAPRVFLVNSVRKWVPAVLSV